MRRIGRKAIAVSFGVAMLWTGGAALLPGTAAATTYTCSGGHLYADGVHVAGDVVVDGNITTSCVGDRVRTVYVLNES